MSARNSIRTAVPVLGLAAMSLWGCAVGVRSEAAFEGEHDLDGITEVILDLPSTALRVLGCDAAVPDTCPPQLRYQGRWSAVGGTQNDAEDNARAPELVFERDASLGRLRADVPLELTGLVDLEFDTATLPDDRGIDLRTDFGDVEVLDLQSAVTIDTGRGDVFVRGAAGGLGVRTGAGFIEAVLDGTADLRTEYGGVLVTQTGTLAELHVHTQIGSIDVELGDDADLDLLIRAPGTIRVRTNAINTVTSGRFERRTGTGVHRVELVTDSGNVEVVVRAQDGASG